MKTKSVVLAAFFILTWGNSRALAALSIDQTHDLSQSVGGTLVFSNYEIGQTFTVGQTGRLGQVDLVLGTMGIPTAPVSFEIRNVLAGLPVDGAPLYQGTIPVSEIPERGSLGQFPLVSVDLIAENLMVDSGDELALVVTSSNPHGFDDAIVWEAGLPGYPAGESFTRFGTQSWGQGSALYDYGFRTWVDTNLSQVVPGPGYSLFETTRALPPDDQFFSGVISGSQNSVGVNFEIVRPTKINSIGGQFLGGAPGQVFGAIVKLDDRNGAPNPTDFSGSDVLGTTLIDLPAGNSTPVDASGDLELMLQPGFYGLWFGSGQFGATGQGFLTSENDPTGAWSVWTLNQPSGNRNFISSNIRVFVEAASAPGTVQLRTVVDAAAEDFGSGVYVIDDGEARIRLDNSPFGSSGKRGILEFDISNIPANAVIESVTLEVDVNGWSSNGNSYPQISLYGYEGDGVATSDDALQTSSLIGTGDEVEDGGGHSVSIDPAYVQAMIAAGADYLGLLAKGASDNLYLEFYPTENRGHGEAPLLTIALSVPGDFDDDYDVDGNDFLAWQRGESPELYSGTDLAIWETNFGGSSSSHSTTVAVPEPAGLVWQMLALVGCLRWWRR